MCVWGGEFGCCCKSPMCQSTSGRTSPSPSCAAAAPDVVPRACSPAAPPPPAQVFITPMPLLRLMSALGLPHLRNLDEAVATMRAAMLGVISDRRAALACGRPVPQDLLGELLAAADEAGQALTDEELWEDVHDVMGAGGVAGWLHGFPWCGALWWAVVCMHVGAAHACTHTLIHIR